MWRMSKNALPVTVMTCGSVTFRSRLLLLTFEESDIFVRATGVNHHPDKVPTLRSLSVRLTE